MTMREGGRHIDYVNYFSAVEYTNWDADMLTGCICDPDWDGFDCSERKCLWGIDPEVTGWVDEQQLLDCTCTTPCAGSVTLSYKGVSTVAIPYDAGENVVQAALNEISSIDDVLVEIFGAGYICPPHGATTKVRRNQQRENRDREATVEKRTALFRALVHTAAFFVHTCMLPPPGYLPPRLQPPIHLPDSRGELHLPDHHPRYPRRDRRREDRRNHVPRQRRHHHLRDVNQGREGVFW